MGHNEPPPGTTNETDLKGAIARPDTSVALRRTVLLIGVVGAITALVVDWGEAGSAANRAWPPFVLVVGLLLIGRVAHADGMFDWAAELTGRLRGSAWLLFVALLGVEAVVTAMLNLDTAVAFLTPVMVLAARRRGLSEAPFLFGALFMANAASLLLPGSNLTNLLVLANDHVSGAVFAARMLPAWVAAVTVTTVVLLVRYRLLLAQPGETDRQPAAAAGRLGLIVTLTAAALVVALRSAALPVLGLGVIAVALGSWRGRIQLPDAAAAVDVPVFLGLFGLAVSLGTLAGSWSGPAQLMQSANRWQTAAIGAGAAVLVNNLPAAVLLSIHAPAHPRALLIGLDLGPNLAVTGSLSALLWFQAAKTVGCRPSLLRVSRIGIVLVPCSAAAALAALAVFAPAHL